MSNLVLGNVYYFDTNGAINNSNSTKIKKVALWCLDATSELTLTVSGSSAVKLAYVQHSTGAAAAQWQECNFGGDGWLVNGASIATVTAGSGYVFVG